MVKKGKLFKHLNIQCCPTITGRHRNYTFKMPYVHIKCAILFILMQSDNR